MAVGRTVVAAALLGSLMGYGAAIDHRNDVPNWPVGGSHDTTPKPRVGL